MNKLIIDGKALAQKIKDEVKAEVATLEEAPKLLIIQAGDNDASNVYVRNKIRACEYCGIEVDHIDVTNLMTSGVLNLIESEQENYDGVMVQLPLPDYLDADKIINAIDPDKDVDGLTDVNVGRLWNGKDGLFPCTALGCIELIKSVYGEDLSGLRTCAIGRSALVGKPVSALLQRENCTVDMCHSKTLNLIKHTNDASVVILATGRPKFFDWTYFETHPRVVIDVGINRDKHGNLCGDLNTDGLDEFSDLDYTPVPGGVGPMTVAMLMKNILKAHKGVKC